MTTVLQWIGSLLKWLDEITGSYMLALFAFALLIEVLMLPLAIYQQKNSIKQARLRPKEMAIKKKYAGRTDNATLQKMRMETQELYQRENFNQMAGCFPLLIQLPIVMALYNVVINPLLYVMRMSGEAITALQYYVTTAVEQGGLGLTLSSNRGTIEYVSLLKEKGLDFFSGLVDFVDGGTVEAIKNLKGNGAAYFEELEEAFSNGLPNLQALGMNLGKAPIDVFSNHSSIGEWLLILVPVLTFVVYYLSSKLTRKFSYQAPTAADADMGCSYKIMDIVMPAMSTYFAFVVPAAVGTYWMFRSVVGTIERFIIQKAMPYPKFTEEDYKEAEREIMGKAGKRKSARGVTDAERSGDRPRSLHHIDDDDAEEYAAAVKRSLETPMTEFSKKSPYYDGPDVDDTDDADSEEDKKDTETEGEGTEKSTASSGMIEKMPLKEDKNNPKKKKKNKNN